jgi:hypothetical protein
VSLLLLLASSDSDAGAAIVCTQWDGAYWQLHAVNPNTGGAKAITATPFDKRPLAVKHATGEVLFRDNEGRLFSMDPKDSSSARTVAGAMEVVKDCDFHARAGLLVSTYAPNAVDNIRIWLMSADGGDKRLLVSLPYISDTPRWMNAQRFIFVRTVHGKSDLWLSDIEGSEPKRVFRSKAEIRADPRPSPNGRLLAFRLREKDGANLWLSGIDGSNARRLYAGPGMEAEPVWALDGQRIYFSTWDGRNFRIARIRPDGEDFAYVTGPGADSRFPVVIGGGSENT